MQKQLKIAVVVESIIAVNGVSRTYQQLISYCQKNNISADFYTLGEIYKEEHFGSVTIYQFKPAIPIPYYPDLPPFDFRLWSPRVVQIFNQQHYDVVHLATPGSLGIAIQYLARRRHIPCVGVFHTQLHDYAYRWALTNNVLFKKIYAHIMRAVVWQAVRWFYCRCDSILAPSLDTQVQLQKKLRLPIGLFPRGVDTVLFNPNKKDDQLKNTTRLVALYVGRLSSEKNLELLAAVFKKITDVQLWFVGEGKERMWLETQLPTARFFGLQEGEALARIYASADFFVFPSTTDTFGNVIMEAHASGLPTIVTTVGGPAQQVTEGITGFIVQPTETAFIHAVESLTKNKGKMQKMGKAAQAAVLPKNWDIAFKELFSAYRELL